MNNLLTIQQIQSKPEIYIGWMCYNIFITIDNQVVNLSLEPLKELLIGGSYCFYVNRKYRTKKYIRKHCVNVLGLIFND
jgi:hypothetical protein